MKAQVKRTIKAKIGYDRLSTCKSCFHSKMVEVGKYYCLLKKIYLDSTDACVSYSDGSKGWCVSMEIEFYISKDETIPTRLRLKVEDVYDVYYESLHDAFGWKFEFFKFQGVSKEMAIAIVDEIVSRMVSQSYDHGAQWRECGVRDIVEDKFGICITVFFRVRDVG